jgi:hypothetical protein
MSAHDLARFLTRAVSLPSPLERAGISVGAQSFGFSATLSRVLSSASVLRFSVPETSILACARRSIFGGRGSNPFRPLESRAPRSDCRFRVSLHKLFPLDFCARPVLGSAPVQQIYGQGFFCRRDFRFLPQAVSRVFPPDQRSRSGFSVLRALSGSGLQPARFRFPAPNVCTTKDFSVTRFCFRC